jgi:hypothetical protein
MRREVFHFRLSLGAKDLCRRPVNGANAKKNRTLRASPRIRCRGIHIAPQSGVGVIAEFSPGDT